MEITNCVTQETTNAAVMGLGSNEQEMLNFARSKLLKMLMSIGVVFKILWFVTIPYANIIQTAKDILTILHL